MLCFRPCLPGWLVLKRVLPHNLKMEGSLCSPTPLPGGDLLNPARLGPSTLTSSNCCSRRLGRQLVASLPAVQGLGRPERRLMVAPTSPGLGGRTPVGLPSSCLEKQVFLSWIPRLCFLSLVTKQFTPYRPLAPPSPLFASSSFFRIAPFGTGEGGNHIK